MYKVLQVNEKFFAQQIRFGLYFTLAEKWYKAANVDYHRNMAGVCYTLSLIEAKAVTRRAQQGNTKQEYIIK